MIVLDTNVISETIKSRPDARVVSWMETLVGEVAITAITLGELLAGVRRLPDGQRRFQLHMTIDLAVGPYRDTSAILAFDDDAAVHYADVLSAREQAGMPISTADAQIAAICRTHRAICATRNTKDFAQTGVDLVNPWLG